MFNMEQICQSLVTCVVCTTRACNWFPAIQQCLWEGRGQVFRQPWECPVVPVVRPGLPTTNPPAATVDAQVQTDEPEDNVALIVGLSCALGLILLAGVAYGTLWVLRNRQRHQGHARLLDDYSSRTALIPPVADRTRAIPPSQPSPRPHCSRHPPPPPSPRTPAQQPQEPEFHTPPEEMEMVDLRPYQAPPPPAPARVQAPPRRHLFGYQLRFGRGPQQPETHSSGYNLRPRKK